MILLFNLLWYVYNKEKAYLYYFLSHILVVVLALDAYKIFDVSSYTVVPFVILFTFLFTREFLNINKYYKKHIKLYNYIAYGFSIVLFLLLASNLAYYVAYIPFSLIFLGLLIVAINIYNKGFSLAKYFIVAWGLNILIIALMDLNRIFSIDILHFEYLGQFGNIAESVLLSFALFAKTRQLNIEKNEKEKMLIHQSRLASMGEMLANISHQWRQPLNRIASFIMNMQIHIMDNYEKEKFLLDKLEESQLQLEYMSSTIDDFTNFYKKDKQKELFYISKSIENAISIIKPSLYSNNIQLDVNIINDFEINSYSKELSQVILNLLQNAKDALVLNKIEKPNIQIVVDNKKIIVKDNALGIDEKIINSIFEPYFTTKEKHKGTGLGLYMSRMILEKNMDASIEARNNKKGVEFHIEF